MTEPLHDHEFGVYCRPACPRWMNPDPQPGWETPRDWYFTFGSDHTNPVTGERLGQAYVVINGTSDDTRTAMFEVFGNRWSQQYDSAERAGVERFKLRHLPLPTVAPAAEQDGDAHVLVDELREEYAQVEADQDRTPSDAGFTAWLAQRARDEECSGCRDILTRTVGEVQERTEEPKQSIAEALDQYGNACAAVAVQADDRLAVEPFDQAMALRREILSRFKEQSEGAAALRADVAAPVAEIRSGLDLLQPLSPGLIAHMRNQLDRIEELMRGEQQ